MGAKRLLRRIPIYMAEAIGFVVAEFRIHVIPKFHKVINNSRKTVMEPVIRSEPQLAFVDSNMFDHSEEKAKPAPKKYNYEWAVTRMQELEDQGVADPVAYLNNEMTDWWLAPDGMMENEADFEGIALAIEERWHN
ncbi:hypothetical protein GUA87_17200 [Sneathiella sp. P13V-1]|uniref:hypothetical protein n=1 Tax=Sneathiella sp. P13V-1 TaxID=2697366 RepID=UPI00187BAD0A|nr:hypothetical protein [Sneathiella sp. P13V-1]MBE7638596.1 hypothetical protein [Sneathiella sp. P13V-1]